MSNFIKENSIIRFLRLIYFSHTWILAGSSFGIRKIYCYDILFWYLYCGEHIFRNYLENIFSKRAK